MIGHDLIRIAPGFNPIRHFMDLLVVLTLFLFSGRGKIFFILAAIVLSWLAVLSSREFGLFISLGLAGTLVIKQLFSSAKISRLELMLAAVTLAGALLCATWFEATKPSLLLYSLMGVSAPSLGFTSLFMLLGGLSILYTVFLKNLERAKAYRWPALFLFLYAQGITIYYVWNGGLHHLLAVAQVWILLLILMLRDFLEGRPEQIRAKTCHALMLASALVYVPAAIAYHVEQKAYHDIFQSHRVFHWDFGRASFETTMDPRYFADAVHLIRKYTGQPGIYLISKYDNLLPLLAERYSAMPFADVATSLVTPKELQLAVDAISSAKPEYIFVDTDIERNLNGDIWHAADPLAGVSALHEESFARVNVLNLLKKVYYAVRRDYQPIEKGILITVYRRIDGAKP
jgi:hypothetical protein